MRSFEFTVSSQSNYIARIHTHMCNAVTLYSVGLISSPDQIYVCPAKNVVSGDENSVRSGSPQL